jgi:ribosomal protein L34E
MVDDDLGRALGSKMFLRIHNKLVGRPENFKGRHLLSNIARCGHCGGPLHAVVRGRNLRLGYVCKNNRMSGSCANASLAPAAELHAAVVRALKHTYTPEAFVQYLAEKASNQSEIDARRAELANLSDVVLPALAQREARLVEAIEDGVALDVVRGRLKEVKAERENVEAGRDELESWVRNEAADRTQAEELAAKWPDWAHALEDDAIVARQALGKLLAGGRSVRGAGLGEANVVLPWLGVLRGRSPRRHPAGVHRDVRAGRREP